jgi:hypothetical protein
MTPLRYLKSWRSGPELNRHTRICSPLHHHSATGPNQPCRLSPGPPCRVKLRLVPSITMEVAGVSKLDAGGKARVGRPAAQRLGDLGQVLHHARRRPYDDTQPRTLRRVTISDNETALERVA